MTANMTLKDLFEDMQEAIEDCKDEGYDYEVNFYTITKSTRFCKTLYYYMETAFQKKQTRQQNPILYLKNKLKRFCKSPEDYRDYISITIKNEHGFNQHISAILNINTAWEEYQKETEDKE